MREREYGGGGGIKAGRENQVFYAEKYHPIQAGSIDGTDILPHDNAVYRALLCSHIGLYDPFGDPKVVGDPYCTIFVGRIPRHTTEETLHKAMTQYGKVKNLRLVRDIVTGASRGYAFVEYETEKEMRRAYEKAHHSFIDDCEIIVDYNRQQLMPGWIPRRLGGGLGGKKESGQLRFGGRERPFRAPLRQIPWEELKRLGIQPPPEGRYMTRFQVPPPPRQTGAHRNRDQSPARQMSEDIDEPSVRRIRTFERERYNDHSHVILEDEYEPSSRRSKRSTDKGDSSHKRRRHGHEHSYSELEDEEELQTKKRRSSMDRDDSSHERHRRHRDQSRSRKRRSRS